jgi:hypothetical protein
MALLVHDQTILAAWKLIYEKVLYWNMIFGYKIHNFFVASPYPTHIIDILMHRKK